MSSLMRALQLGRPLRPHVEVGHRRDVVFGVLAQVVLELLEGLAGQHVDVRGLRVGGRGRPAGLRQHLLYQLVRHRLVLVLADGPPGQQGRRGGITLFRGSHHVKHAHGQPPLASARAGRRPAQPSLLLYHHIVDDCGQQRGYEDHHGQDEADDRDQIQDPLIPLMKCAVFPSSDGLQPDAALA